MNGRTKGDAIGNFTHLNANSGTSTIDYALCNQYLYKSVENFFILPINEISDHSKLTTLLNCGRSTIINEDKYKWNKLQTRFKWDKTNHKKFVKNLRERQTEIDEISQRIEAGLIESTGNKIQELYFDVLSRPE